jgi:Mrp family chromosome partitioning ATPase
LGLWYAAAVDGGLSVRSVFTWVGGGLAGGLGLALGRELSRNTITALSSLGKHRGYAVLGAAPELTLRTLRELPPDQRTPLACLAYQPASPFATAFRDLQGNLAGDRFVSFIGAFPGEGATTSALCAAASATQQGLNVIVVDCDLRRRSLTLGFGMEPELGVLEACERPEYWRDYVEHEGEIGVHFLPAARPLSPWRSLIGEAGFRVLLKELRGAYDLVVLDCPPALSSADGPMIARMADKCVLVAVWDQTPLAAIRSAMRVLRARARSSTGVYVNRVPPGYRFGRLRPD